MAELAIRTPDDRADAHAQIDAMEMPFRVAIRKPLTRSEQQNKTIHKWFGEIAAHVGDMTAIEIKAQCNVAYGVGIKMRDNEDWHSVFGHLFRGLNYEQKIKAIRVLDVPFTRSMTVKQLTEYMDQMQRDYLSQGVALTIPEDKRP